MKYWRNGFTVVTLGLLSACGAGDEGAGAGGIGSPVTIGGALDGAYSIATVESPPEKMLASPTSRSVAAAGEQVDQVWGVPIYRFDGEVYANFTQAVKVDVDSTGEFSLALDDARDWVLLLIDTTQPLKKNQIVGYVATADLASNASMLLMPVSEATSQDIDIGTLTQIGDEAQSSSSLEQQQTNYDVTLAELRELASVDDTFKAIRNRFVNYDESTGDYYFLRLGFHWQTPLADTDNQYSDHALMTAAGTRYKGYTVEAQTNLAPPGAVCASDAGSRVPVEIIPPADVNHSSLGYTYNATTPFSNDERGQAIGDYDATSCYDEDINISHTSAQGEPYRFGGPWGLDYLAGAVPAGEWSFRIDNVEVASFDVAAGYPFDANDYPTVYFPAVRITTDGDDEITAIEVAWYHYDAGANGGAGGYVQVLDTSMFAQLSGSHFIGLTDYSGTSGDRIDENHYREDGMVVSLAAGNFDNPGWILGTNDGNTLALDELAVGYSMGDTSYRFSFRD